MPRFHLANRNTAKTELLGLQLEKMPVSYFITILLVY